MRPLGKNQIFRLCALGCPSMYQVVGDKEARSLAQRHLIEAHGKDGDSMFSITPFGLRCLAEMLECGKLDEIVKPPKLLPKTHTMPCAMNAGNEVKA